MRIAMSKLVSASKKYRQCSRFLGRRLVNFNPALHGS